MALASGVIRLSLTPLRKLPTHRLLHGAALSHRQRVRLTRVLHQHYFSRSLTSARLLATLGRVLRLRYFVVAGATGGSFALAKKYDEVKSAMPDMQWLQKYVPENYREDLTNYMNSCRNFVNDVAPPKGWLNDRVVKVSSWLSDGFSSKTPLLPANEVPAEQVKSSFSSFFGSGTVEERSRADELQEELVKMQSKYQREIELLEKEVRELRSQLNSSARSSKEKRVMKSLIDLYSEVLDALAVYDSKFSVVDHLPRVVVVGDQSAGKTSVLEMIAQARIFPRGAGEMMTRAPVQVTLAEGPFHVARFKDNPSKEYDLTKESELSALRAQIERKMKSVVTAGGTISTETISLTVQGPGLPRMVLVDLPGIISTETKGMATKTKENIRALATQHMKNPNAIILCVADACVDAERSNAFDLVAKHDPSGRRTIFVLTKVDLAERDKVSPDRIAKLLSGRLLPLKALGYFAVVTGSGGSDDSIPAIKKYEEEFFKNSRLFRDGVLSLGQMTAGNMAQAVSRRFWALVRESVEAQADAFKATRFNLETEWKHLFPRRRQLSRTELYDRARSELLDEVISLSSLKPEHWENIFKVGLTKALMPQAVALMTNVFHVESDADFHTAMDISLRRWADSALASAVVDVGWNTLYTQLASLPPQPEHDPILEPLQEAVRVEARRRHTWDPKAEQALRVLQAAAMDERSITTRAAWDSAVSLMDEALTQQVSLSHEEIEKLKGPTRWRQWMHWTRKSEQQERADKMLQELSLILQAEPNHSPEVSPDELTAARRNLLSHHGLENVSTEELSDVWPSLYRHHALTTSLRQCRDCSRLFYHYQQGLPTDCRSVLIFYRLRRLLEASSAALRHQVINNEVHRLEKAVKEVLDDWSGDRVKLENHLTGKSVQLAEDIQRLQVIEEKLDEFIDSLNKSNERR